MNKITIIGSGSVGSTIANDLMIQGTASEIVLIDVNKQKAFGEAMDQVQPAWLQKFYRVRQFWKL